MIEENVIYTNDLVTYIKNKTGLKEDVIMQVLDLEEEYLMSKGIIQVED